MRCCARLMLTGCIGSGHTCRRQSGGLGTCGTPVAQPQHSCLDMPGPALGHTILSACPGRTNAGGHVCHCVQCREGASSAQLRTFNAAGEVRLGCLSCAPGIDAAQQVWPCNPCPRSLQARQHAGWLLPHSPSACSVHPMSPAAGALHLLGSAAPAASGAHCTAPGTAAAPSRRGSVACPHECQHPTRRLLRIQPAGSQRPQRAAGSLRARHRSAQEGDCNPGWWRRQQRRPSAAPLAR